MDITCPIDKKDDAIQKLSVLVTSGQSSGIFSGPSGGMAYVDGKWGTVGGYTTLSGSTISILARLLSLPPEPQKKGGIGFLWAAVVFLYIIAGLIVLFFIVLICFIFYLIVNIIINPISNDTSITNPYVMFGAIVFGLVILVIFILSVFILCLRGIRSLLKENKNKKEAGEVIYFKEKAIWDTAREKWNRLYFCYRHGIVFDPENGKSCDPTFLKEFLNTSTIS